MFHGGQPSGWNKHFDRLRDAMTYIISRSYPEKYPEIKRALFNFKDVANDFLRVFDKYADVAYHDDEDPEWEYLITRKFYKIDAWDTDLYNRLLRKYYYHCFLVEDLALEMTRSLNYIFEVVRKHLDTKFRIEEGLLLVEIGPFSDFSYHTIIAEYGENEKEALYQGLRDYMESRAKRSYYRDNGFSDDYFQKLY